MEEVETIELDWYKKEGIVCHYTDKDFGLISNPPDSRVRMCISTKGFMCLEEDDFKDILSMKAALENIERYELAKILVEWGKKQEYYFCKAKHENLLLMTNLQLLSKAPVVHFFCCTKWERRKWMEFKTNKLMVSYHSRFAFFAFYVEQRGN